MGIQNPQNPELGFFPEGAGQTFLTGDPVTLSAGLLVAMTTGTLHGQKLVGFAQADATGVTNTMRPVEVVNSETVIRVPVTAAGSISAAAVTAMNQVGATFALWYTVATGILSLNLSDTSADNIVRALDATYAVGEQFGTVDVQMLAVQCLFP